MVSEQYDDAEAFLVGLTDLLLDGDRSRVVICPGNHDVDWNQAHASMRKVDPASYPRDVWSALSAPGSGLRWSWSDCSLYEIVDAEQYERRMEKYWAFLRRFYEPTSIRQVPSKPDEPLLVELFERRVLVAAFNSCSANDCFNDRGEINAQAIAQLHLDLQRDGWAHELKVAVWHHNTKGPPSANDYINVEQIHALIDYGFRLGLHGHQHHSEVSLHELRLPAQQSLAVLSAGSLAAGQPELPRGANRQYNLIELRDDWSGARIHLREVETGTVFGPRRLNSFGGRSYDDIAWEPVQSEAGTKLDSNRLNTNFAIDQAERAYKGGDPTHAAELLLPLLGAIGAYGRGLFARSVEDAGLWQMALDGLLPPQTIDELTVLAKAAVALGEFEIAKQVVREHSMAVGLPLPQREELVEWISGEEATR